jgi:hypothetical protein
MGSMQEKECSRFQNNSSTNTMLVAKIKKEAAMWCLVGAKALSNSIPQEYTFVSNKVLGFAKADVVRPLKLLLN